MQQSRGTWHATHARRIYRRSTNIFAASSILPSSVVVCFHWTNKYSLQASPLFLFPSPHTYKSSYFVLYQIQLDCCCVAPVYRSRWSTAGGRELNMPYGCPTARHANNDGAWHKYYYCCVDGVQSSGGGIRETSGTRVWVYVWLIFGIGRVIVAVEG